MLRWYDRKFTCNEKTTRQYLQEDYENVYIGSEFNLQARYATSTNLIFVVFLYSAGMPVMYFRLPLFYIVSYWADKYLCNITFYFNSSSIFQNTTALQFQYCINDPIFI